MAGITRRKIGIDGAQWGDLGTGLQVVLPGPAFLFFSTLRRMEVRTV